MTASVLETARLRLEPWDERHTEMLVRLSSLPAVTRFIGAGGTWTSRMAAAPSLARPRPHACGASHQPIS